MLSQHFDTQDSILDFNFSPFQTRLLITCTAKNLEYDLVTQKSLILPFQGHFSQHKHLKFIVKNNTIYIYKLNNLLKVCAGSLVTYCDKLAVSDQNVLRIIDLTTMEELKIPSYITLKLEYNEDGSMLFQLTADFLLVYDSEMRKLTVGNIIDFDFVGCNELVTLNGESVYLLIVQDMKITTVFLQATKATRIFTYNNFVCLVDGGVVEMYVLNFRPLPRLDKMYLNLM